MNIYVVYDKQTGRIVHTTARYVLGTDEPIACTDDEVLSLAREEVGRDIQLGVAKVPDGFDVSDRTRSLKIDLKTGTCRSYKLEKPKPRKKAGSKPKRRKPPNKKPPVRAKAGRKTAARKKAKKSARGTKAKRSKTSARRTRR